LRQLGVPKQAAISRQRGRKPLQFAAGRRLKETYRLIWIGGGTLAAIGPERQIAVIVVQYGFWF
jgi:hypothetical protein